MTINYPVLFDYRGTTMGKGFMAEVSAHGRVLVTRADADGVQEWWFFGVNPGAVSASGSTFDEAHEDFREGLRQIFAQFAAETASIDQFRREAEAFFHAVNEPTLVDWNAAVDRVRQTKDTLEDLPVRGAARVFSIEIRRKSERDVTPSDNNTEVTPSLANAQPKVA